MRYILAVAATFSLVCCRAPRAPVQQPGRSAAPAGAAVKTPADDDAWCKGDTSPHFPAPGPLAREFVARDGAGGFLSTNSFWLAATECAGEGTDYATVVSSYSIDSLGVRGDSAWFPVTYRYLGDLMDGVPHFVPRVHTIVDTFVIIHRPYGWRIVGMHDLPRLLVKTAKAQWPLTSADSVRLDSAERVSRGSVAPN